MECFFKSLSAFIIKYHKAIAIFALLLGSLSFFFVQKLEFKTDILDVFPANAPKIEPFKDFITDFGSNGNLIIVLEARDKDMLSHLDIAEDIAARFDRSPLINYVEYNVFASSKGLMLRNFPLYLDGEGLGLLGRRLSRAGVEAQIKSNKDRIASPLFTPADEMLIAKDPLNLRQLITSTVFKGKAKNFKGGTGYYLSTDGSMMMIIARPIGASMDFAFMDEFSRELLRITAGIEKDYGEVVSLGYTGPFGFALEAHSAMSREVYTTFAGTVVVIFILFQFVYRKRFLVLLLMGCSLFLSLSLTLTFAYFLFGGLNMASSIVAAMLMGLTIDYLLHSFNSLEDEYRESSDIAKAMEASFIKVLPGVVVGAITTALAFFSIVVTSFKGLHEMGLVAGLGVFTGLLASVFFMSSAVVWLRPYIFKANKVKTLNDSKFYNLSWLARPALVLGAVALLASIIFIPSIGFDSSPESLGIKNSQAERLGKKISSMVEQKNTPLIVIGRGESREELFDFYGLIEEKIAGLKLEGVVGDATSLSLFLPPPARQLAAIERLSEVRSSGVHLKENFFYALGKYGFKIDDYYNGYIDNIIKAINVDTLIGLAQLEKESDYKAGFFYNREKLAVASYLYPSDGETGWDAQALASVERSLELLGDKVVITGLPVITGSLAGTIIKESSLASVLSLLAISLVLYLSFRSVKKVLLILLPISLGFVYTGTMMGVLGVDFNYINIGVVTLIFGIGVDYGVYMIQGYNTGGLKGLRCSSRSVFMCALTSAVGFGSLMTMSFKGVASFGSIVVMGIAACVFAALVVLPAVLTYIDKRGENCG